MEETRKNFDFAGLMKRFSGAIIRPVLFLAVAGILPAFSVILRMDVMPEFLHGIGDFIYNVDMNAGINNLGLIVCIGLILGCVNGWINSLQGLIASSGYFGQGLYGFLNKVLIPTGMHHLMWMPFLYAPVGGTAQIAGETFSGAYNISQEARACNHPLQQQGRPG